MTAVMLLVAVLLFPRHAQADAGFLQQDMTMPEVREAVGRTPDVVQPGQCGAEHWECTMWQFALPNGDTLAVTFRLEGSDWLVNGWRVNRADRPLLRP
jgi:hypothetical protein